MSVPCSRGDVPAPVVVRRDSEYPLNSSTRHAIDEGFAEVDDDDNNDHELNPMRVLVSFKTPDYLKDSCSPSQLQDSPSAPSTPKSAAVRLCGTIHVGLDTKGFQSHISEVTVDQYMDDCLISTSSPQVKQDYVGEVAGISSQEHRSLPILNDNYEPNFLHVEDQEIFDAFEDEGHAQSVFLYNLLKRAHAVRIRERSIDEFLTDLESWKNEVATATIYMIYRVTRVYGYGQDKRAYEWTSDFCIYFWWRICKIVCDIENYATSQPTNTKILLSDSTLDVFESLSEAFHKAICSDIESLKENNDLATKSAQAGGFVSIIELLDQRILFQDAPDLSSLPAHLYKELGRIRRSFTAEMGDQNGIEQLQFLLEGYPVLNRDFESVVSELKETNRRTSQSSTLSNSKSPNVRSSQIKTQVDRPFQVYLARVMVYADQKTVKEVRSIYYSLVQGNEPVSRIFVRLRRLFAGTPHLLRQFRDFVPRVAERKWKAAENSIRTQDQVASHKRRLRLEWIRLIEEHQKKTGCQLPWHNFVESMELKKLQTSMCFLQAALKKIVPFQSSLTPQAWSKIQILTQRLARFTETVSSAVATLETLTEEERPDWEKSLKIDAESIAEELRRRSVADVLREEMDVNEVQIFSPQMTSSHLGR